MAAKTPRSIWFLLFGVLAFVAVGCGGDDSSGDDGADEESAAEPLDEDEFVDQFDEACTETAEEIESIPEPQDYDDLVDASEEATEIATGGLDALREITPPEDLADDVEDLLDVLEERTDLFDGLREAAENEDDDEINDVIAAAEEIIDDEIKEIAEDLGLECFAEDEDEDGGDSGDGGGGDLNADIQAYCDEVESFIAELEAAGTDPAALADVVRTGAEELAAAVAGLEANVADFTPEDAEALADCQAEATEGLSSLDG